MALSSRRPVERSITRAAVGLITAGFLASCGVNTIAGAPVEQTTTSQPASASGEVRLGCGTYCQSAGPLGGDTGTGVTAVTIVSSGTVTLDADGYVPVTVTCNLSVQCSGGLFAENNWAGRGGGRSDLLIDAGATRTFGVRQGPDSLAYIRSHGPTTLAVTADSGQSPGTAHWAPGAGGPWVGGIIPVDWKGLTVVAPG